MPLANVGMGVEGPALLPDPYQVGSLRAGDLAAHHQEFSRGRPQEFPKAEHVDARVIRLEDEVADVDAVVLSPVLSVELRSTPRKRHTKESGGKLVVVSRELVVRVAGVFLPECLEGKTALCSAI